MQATALSGRLSKKQCKIGFVQKDDMLRFQELIRMHLAQCCTDGAAPTTEWGLPWGVDRCSTACPQTAHNPAPGRGCH